MHSIEQYGTTMGVQSTLQAHLQKLRLHSLEKRKRNTNVRVTTQNLVASVGYANVDRTRAKTQRKKRVLKAPDRASQGVVHRKVMTKISALQTWGDRRR
jgi:hypothetical protein